MMDWVVKTLIAASLPFAHGAPNETQAQEHGNATLTWRCPLKADAPLASLYIHLLTMKPEGHCQVYLYAGQQQPLYQDQLYRGRVQCDLELAQQGRIECVFSDLRLNDTGSYICIAGFDRREHFNRGTQYLRVTETDPTPCEQDPGAGWTSEPSSHARDH